MKYIWCEDSGSGFFFWEQINKVFFNNKYTVKSSNGIDQLEKDIASVQNDGNEYLVCFDNCTDNKEIASRVSALRKLERQSNNIHLVQYICFEQVIISSPEITKFIPNIANDIRYSIAKQHFEKDYKDADLLLKLCKSSQLPQYQYSTTERFFKPILEENAIVSETKSTIQSKNNQLRSIKKYIMCHHYIRKGNWSRCWLMDCTPDCPENYCWKAYSACNSCEDPLNNVSCTRFTSDNANKPNRKYEELIHCNREENNIPSKQSERIQMLFENSILKELLFP